MIKSKPTRKLILSMVILVGLAIFAAGFFYRKKNNAVDPRIRGARELYKEYNLLAIENKFMDILVLLDSIEAVYSMVPHYRDSYETGVLYNNRTATYLTMALFKDSLKFKVDPFNRFTADSLVKMAEQASVFSIGVYNNWLATYDGIAPDSLKSLIKETFLTGLDPYDQKSKSVFLDARVKELIDAQNENKRRLSVAYTNYGVIKRYNEDYKGAALCYQKALELWDRNLTAENNLNKLLGKPLKKRNLIQKLFPPEKD